MHVHRIRHTRGFTVLPNSVLQDRQLSYTARGLLADLLSRPDGWREDGRHMADTSPQGRAAVAKALRELARAGLYVVRKVRQADGTFVTEVHVFDTPQPANGPVPPSAAIPGSGAATPGGHGVPGVKNLGKEPSLPPVGPAEPPTGGPTTPAAVAVVASASADSAPAPDLPLLAAQVPDQVVREAVAVLFRVLRREPRLRLGEAEALNLAPLVAGWLDDGATEQDLATALLPGLPQPVHAPAALLRDRLTRKRPPQQPAPAPAGPRWSECPTCHDPVARPGLCRPCAGLAPRTTTADDERTTATARGMAKVRAALLGTPPVTATRA